MSEMSPEAPGLPQLTNMHGYLPYLDREITAMLAQYIDEVEADPHGRFLERKAYREAESISEKVDKACWEWGARPADFEKAVELKSLQALRVIESAIFSDEATKKADYLIPSVDEYWQAVDRRIYAHLGMFVREEAGTEIPPFGTYDLEALQPICGIGGYVISRLARDGTWGFVHYLATPVGPLLAQA